MIYFALCGPLVKIGYSRRPAERLRELPGETAYARSYPLVLLGVVPGERPGEFALHERFAGSRVDGEWFRATEDILAYVRENDASLSLLPVKGPSYTPGPAAQAPWLKDMIDDARGRFRPAAPVAATPLAEPEEVAGTKRIAERVEGARVPFYARLRQSFAARISERARRRGTSISVEVEEAFAEVFAREEVKAP